MEWQPIETLPARKIVLGVTTDGRYKLGERFRSTGVGKYDALVDPLTGRWIQIAAWMIPPPFKAPETAPSEASLRRDSINSLHDPV